MRKINLHTELDPYTFETKATIKIRNEDGEKTEIELGTLEPISTPKPKYTEEELNKIQAVNEHLEANGQDTMTEQEADFMLGKFQPEEPTVDEITKLSGYEVVTEVRPFGKQTKSGIEDVTDELAEQQADAISKA